MKLFCLDKNPEMIRKISDWFAMNFNQKLSSGFLSPCLPENFKPNQSEPHQINFSNWFNPCNPKKFKPNRFDQNISNFWKIMWLLDWFGLKFLLLTSNWVGSKRIGFLWISDSIFVSGEMFGSRFRNRVEWNG